MRRIFLSVVFFALFSLLYSLNTNKAFATCSATITNPPPPLTLEFIGDATITTETDCFQDNQHYQISAIPNGKEGEAGKYSFETRRRINGKNIRARIHFDQITFGVPPAVLYGDGPEGEWTIRVCPVPLHVEPDWMWGNRCTGSNPANVAAQLTITVSRGAGTTLPSDVPAPKLEIAKQAACRYQIGETPILHISNLLTNQAYQWWWLDSGLVFPIEQITGTEMDFPLPARDNQVSRDRTVCVDVKDKRRGGENCLTLNFTGGPPTEDRRCTSSNQSPTVDTGTIPTPPCGTNPQNAICDTAIGKIQVSSPQSFLEQLFSIILAIAGIGAILLIIYAAFLLMTSGGDKQKVQGARETITSAITGLLFIIFSIAILGFLGVNILKIPGFGS